MNKFTLIAENLKKMASKSHLEFSSSIKIPEIIHGWIFFYIQTKIHGFEEIWYLCSFYFHLILSPRNAPCTFVLDPRIFCSHFFYCIAYDFTKRNTNKCVLRLEVNLFWKSSVTKLYESDENVFFLWIFLCSFLYLCMVLDVYFAAFILFLCE